MAALLFQKSKSEEERGSRGSAAFPYSQMQQFVFFNLGASIDRWQVDRSTLIRMY